MKCVSKEWYKGDQYRCVLASDSVPTTLPKDGGDVDGMNERQKFAPLSMLFVIDAVAETKVYLADESGVFVAQ